MNFSDYLICPTCKTNIVKKGCNLFCDNCKKEYEIIEGIPILVDFQKIPKHLADQIRYFEKEDVLNNHRLEVGGFKTAD